MTDTRSEDETVTETDESETTTDVETATVLVVEDESDLASLYATWLEDDYEVETAHDGEQALEILDDDVDVILLDRRMPGLSGDEVLEHVRDRGLNVRVAIVSAVTPDFDILEMGFDDYLVKPVDEADLHDVVERLLARATYDETLAEIYQLTSTKAALEEQKSREELQRHDEYVALNERLQDLRETAEVTVEAFDDDDFRMAFRDIEDDTSHDHEP